MSSPDARARSRSVRTARVAIEKATNWTSSLIASGQYPWPDSAISRARSAADGKTDEIGDRVANEHAATATPVRRGKPRKIRGFVTSHPGYGATEALQLTAFFTSAAIFFSSAAVSSFSA